MLAGQMRIDRGFFKIAMAEQDLDGTQVSTGLKKVGGETMAEQMGIDPLLIEAGTFGSALTGRPKDPWWSPVG